MEKNIPWSLCLTFGLQRISWFSINFNITLIQCWVIIIVLLYEEKSQCVSHSSLRCHWVIDWAPTANGPCINHKHQRGQLHQSHQSHSHLGFCFHLSEGRGGLRSSSGDSAQFPWRPSEWAVTLARLQRLNWTYLFLKCCYVITVIQQSSPLLAHITVQINSPAWFFTQPSSSQSLGLGLYKTLECIDFFLVTVLAQVNSKDILLTYCTEQQQQQQWYSNIRINVKLSQYGDSVRAG